MILPLTLYAGLFARLTENGINRHIQNMMRQRPSLFNYGTQSFLDNDKLFCQPIVVATGLPPAAPRVTLEPPLPVPGTSGAWGLEYCMQLTNVAVDLHPAGRITLPRQLRPLGPQALSVQGTVYAAIACPRPEVLAGLGDLEGNRYQPTDPAASIRAKPTTYQTPAALPAHRIPLDPNRIHCFSIDLFATARIRHDTFQGHQVLVFELTGFELADLAPSGLESSLECLIKATIQLGVLPRLQVLIDNVVLAVGTSNSLIFSMMPTSPAIPFNPSIRNNAIDVFVSVVLA